MSPRSFEGKREREGNNRRFFPRWVQGEGPLPNENRFYALSYQE